MFEHLFSSPLRKRVAKEVWRKAALQNVRVTILQSLAMADDLIAQFLLAEGATMSSEKTNLRPHANRTVLDYRAGTKIYNYSFLHPVFGWVGGNEKEDWHDKKGPVEVLMTLCCWPTVLIERIA